jgi:P-type conjugative transfer protein TrbL
MTATALDTITAAFVSALQGGAETLGAFALPLLGVLAIIAFYTQLGPLLAMGGVGAGDAIASALLLLVRTGIFYWLLVNLSPLATAAFQTFLLWGNTAVGGSVTANTFTTPSTLIDLGFKIGKPLLEFGSLWQRLTTKWLPVMAFLHGLAYYAVLLSFLGVALHLMMTIIEYHMAVLVGAVLMPFGVLQPLAFFGEFSIGWLTGGLVRILVTGAIIGIAVPLFDVLSPTTTAGGDPTVYSSLMMAFTALVFAILSWVVPGRAASIAGRGVSLALHGGAIVAGAAGGLRGVLAVQAAIRGISSLLRR